MKEAREHARRERITAQLAAADQRAAGISSCTLCDDDGRTPSGLVCDHVDRSDIHVHGRALVNAMMGWDRSWSSC